MPKYGTIKDRNGDIHTGRVVSTKSEPVGGFLGTVLTGGANLAFDNTPTVTVEYNGERHSGTPLKSR